MNFTNLTKGILVIALSGVGLTLTAQTKRQLIKIKQNNNGQRLRSLSSSFKRQAKERREEAFSLAKKNGWKTSYSTKKGNFVELQKVVNGKPIYYTTFNGDAAKSTRTNHLKQGGSLGLNLMGDNLTAYIWDGGVALPSHQEYDGDGGFNRFRVGDLSRFNYHSAHVAGTIMASGLQPEAQGMAPHANAVGYDWNADKQEVVREASNGMLISNHSYGYSVRDEFGRVQLPQSYFGGYIDESRDWDEILFNAPNYLMVVAAGNDGRDDSANDNPTGGFGFDKLSGHSVSKNNLVVANAQDADIDAQGNLLSVSINSSSSEGPTDDFRIKPDITGNGTQVYSTLSDHSDSYGNLTGTSMASPNVTGSLLLLQEHYNNVNDEFMKAATLKGLALHTADDAGVDGPDAVFGWGLLNTKKAAEVITNRGESSVINELTLANGSTYSIEVEADGNSPLFASISWTDRPGQANQRVNSRTPALVNDLDIRVSKVNGARTYLPYKLTGALTNSNMDNNVDPYERVDVENPNGKYIITVTHKGNLVGGLQNYSLIVTGLKSVEDDNGSYCEAQARSFKEECIKRVQLGTIDNSLKTTSGYSDFTNISTLLDKTNTITITPQWAGSSYKEGYSVYIDYNQDGDFDDQGEKVFTKAPTRSAKVSGTFTVPSSAKEGETRMRVMLAYNKVVSQCDVFSYGEVEDYTVVVGNGVAADTSAPTNPLSVVSEKVTTNSAKITWLAASDNVAVTGYNVYNSFGAKEETNNKYYNLVNLDSNTEYTFYVSAFDAKGNESEKVKVNFTTLNDNVTYCDASSGSSSYEWIDHVSLGGIYNNSGSDKGYGDYTSKVGTVSKGSTTVLGLSAGFTSSGYTQYWCAWIDFNKDGEFTRSELVVSGYSDKSYIISSNIEIPNTALLGNTTMRVAMKFGSYPSSCGSFNFGEVEDYTVNITSDEVSNLDYAVKNDMVTGSFDQTAVLDLVAYPIPAEDVVNVKLASTSRNMTYTIFDAKGVLVKSDVLVNKSISVSDLSSGVYVLNVNDGQRVLTTKLVKK